MDCTSCGTQVPVNARFCPSCGSPVKTATDERRVVSVVFADLVGFTSLSETRDPERVKNLVDGCFRRLAADVTTFGGRVDKVVGDAMLALFGAPVAHEDDAERAVRAAIDMQSTLADLSRELDAPLALRIGVNTGEVLVGALRAGGDYTAMGDVVNVASRLQTMAEPGEILVGRSTYTSTQGAIRYTHRGRLSARGRDEAVEAWSAIEPVSRPGMRPRRERSPLVGREPELALLRQAVISASRRNRAQLVLVLGEPGVGKSRLVEELATWARCELDTTVLEGRCPPYGEANRWWPLNEALRGLIGVGSDDEPGSLRATCRRAVAGATGLSPDGREVDRVTAGLAYLMGDDDALRDVDPNRVQDEARLALSAYLDGLGRKGPVLLALHALQWADPVVTSLIDHLLARPRRLPLVVVATARPDVESLWSPRPGPYDLINLHVDPLDAVSAEELLSSLAGDVAPTVRDLLVDRSGGNPLFLEEMLALIEADPGVTPAELPATLRGMVSARIDALGPEERAVIEDASVIGRDGTREALDALALARGSGDTQEIVNSLAARDQLAVDGRSWSFRSDLTREVAYETLTKAARALRHFRLASWLSERAKSSVRGEDPLAVVARHLGQAAELVSEVGTVEGIPADLPDRALDQLRRATDRAVRLGQRSEIVRLVGRALAVAPDTAPGNRRQLLLERAQAHAHLHNPAAARSDIDDALAIAPADDRDAALGLLALGSVEVAEGHHDASAANLAKAFEKWRDLGDHERAAESLSELGMSYFLGGHTDKANATLSEVVRLSRAQGLRRTEAWALWNLASIAFTTGNPVESERRIEEARQAFTDVGDSGGLDFATGLLGFVRFFQGRRREANTIVDEVVGKGFTHGDSWGLAMMLFLLSNLRLWDGRTSEAFAPATEARRLFHEVGNVEGEIRAVHALAAALAADGQVRAALDTLDEAATLASGATGVGSLVTGNELGVESLMGVLRTELHAGLCEQAMAEIERAASSGLVVTNDSGTVAGSEWLALVGLAHLQTASVEQSIAMLEQAVAAAASEGPRAHALATLSLALVAGGRTDEARSMASQVAPVEAATYMDRVLALIASAFAALGTPDASSNEEMSDAVSLADATGDRLLQAVVRLARARLVEAAGRADSGAKPRARSGQASPGADEAGGGEAEVRAGLAEARSRLHELGTDAPGWDSVFTEMARGALSAGRRSPATRRS